MIFRYRSARRKLFGSVHADQLTGNVFSAGAAQENREMRNVLRFSDMLQTAQSFDRFFPVAAEPDPGAGRVDVPGMMQFTGMPSCRSFFASRRVY